jgi:hypothetical protein
MIGLTGTCKCGHPAIYHEHYRAASHCTAKIINDDHERRCGCARFRKKRWFLPF